jgi:voltage-gated sodium channel
MTTENQTPAWKTKIESVMNHAIVQHSLVALIILNAAILGIETSHTIMHEWGPALIILDHAILAIFIVEIVLLIASRGLKFFEDPWCVFDFIVVGIALMPASGSLAVLRALRVLRVLRLINKVQSMRKVVSGLLSALPGLGSVFGLILIIFYVAAVIATNLFGLDFPGFFGDLGKSAFTLFQVMTLEGWSEGIARPVMELFPYAWIFFLFFILIATFIVINLFIAVIVDSLTSNNSEDADAQAHSNALAITHELKAMREEIRELRQRLN